MTESILLSVPNKSIDAPFKIVEPSIVYSVWILAFADNCAISTCRSGKPPVLVKVNLPNTSSKETPSTYTSVSIASTDIERVLVSGSVVSITLSVPATTFRESLFVPATILDCPVTIIFLNIF